MAAVGAASNSTIAMIIGTICLISPSQPEFRSVGR
jgi:hypothetical protein